MIPIKRPVFEPLEWTPLHRVGPFVFGEAIPERLLQHLEVLPELFEEEVAYKAKGRSELFIRVAVEKGHVSTIYCDQSLIYEGRETIGLTKETLIEVIRTEPSSS